MKYRSLSDYLKETFGTKVYKLSLQSGCTCPNRDGKINYGGCTFCSEGGSGDFAAPLLPIDQQIQLAREKVDGKFSSRIAKEDRLYIAYFQSYTNTYGDAGRLGQLYAQTLQHPEIAGLSIGTRPDCLPDDIMDMLRELTLMEFPFQKISVPTQLYKESNSFKSPGLPLNHTDMQVSPDQYPNQPDTHMPQFCADIYEEKASPQEANKKADTCAFLTRKPIWVELGLQTIHEKTAEDIHRGYSLETFVDAYQKLRAIGVTVIVHVILGLPGESREDMLETIRFLSSLTPTLQGIKLQLLHVLKGTALATRYQAEPFHVFTLEEYADLVVDCLKILPEETVVHRITGDGPKKLLIAPLWSANKKVVLNTLQKKIREA